MAMTAALLGFIAVSSLAGLLLSLAAGFLTVPVAWAALLIGAVSALGIGFACRHVRSDDRSPGFFEWAAILFFLLFCLRNFLWVYYNNGDSVYTLNRYPYADLHIHIGMIKNFVEGSPFWPSNPIFTGAKLFYHFGMDFFTALFLKAGMPLTRSLPLTGVLCGVLTLLMLFRWGRGFTVAGFLCAGGLAGFLFFTTHSIEDYQADLAWKNIALTMFLPQRGYLFALPAGLLVLWSWRRRFLENKPGFPFWIEGFFWGIMPYFQFHAFLFLSFIFVVWTLAARKIREALPVYFSALPLAVPFVLVLTNFFQKSSMIWLHPGWMMGEDNPFVFFLVNFGFFVPVVLWTGWRVIRSRDLTAQCLFFPAFGLFLVCMFVMFGPWEWDNTKLFSPGHITFLSFFSQWFRTLCIVHIGKYLSLILRHPPSHQDPRSPLTAQRCWTAHIHIITASVLLLTAASILARSRGKLCRNTCEYSADIGTHRLQCHRSTNDDEGDNQRVLSQALTFLIVQHFLNHRDTPVLIFCLL